MPTNRRLEIPVGNSNSDGLKRSAVLEEWVAVSHVQRSLEGRSRQGAGSRGALARESDADLFGLIAAGDEPALGELYDRFGRFAYGLAFHIVRDPGLAEEAVQEAFVSVWRSAHRFDGRRGTARSWLLTIVHRRAVDLVQLAVRGPDVAPRDVTELTSASTEETAVVREEQRVVRQALELLPGVQRQALELAYYGGLSQSQVALCLGVPLGTVKSRIFHGLRRLSALLSNSGAVSARASVSERPGADTTGEWSAASEDALAQS